MKEIVIVRNLGMQEYVNILQRMQEFTMKRNTDTIDEVWCLQHPAVFTQGQAGKAEHLLAPGNIPVTKSDRGGQVTYHGPGQLIVYLLCDLNRKQLGIKQLTAIMQQAVVDLLAEYNVVGHTKAEAPGVYVAAAAGNDILKCDGYTSVAKICSLGLRVRKGCSYHGLSLNVAMNLEPFKRINPCGHAGMQMAQLADFVNALDVELVAEQLLTQLLLKLEYTERLSAVTLDDSKKAGNSYG